MLLDQEAPIPQGALQTARAVFLLLEREEREHDQGCHQQKGQEWVIDLTTTVNTRMHATFQV